MKRRDLNRVAPFFIWGCGAVAAAGPVPGRLFARDGEQVETGVVGRGDGGEAVVVHADRGGERRIFTQELAPVEAVEQVVGELQQAARQAVLEVEDVEPGDARDALPVLLVVGHHPFVAEDALHVDLSEAAAEEQRREPVGRVFAHVPRVAREREGGVGGRDDEKTSRAQHAPDLGDEGRVALDVLDDLERDNGVEARVVEGQRRYRRPAELHAGAVDELGRGGVFVDGDEARGVRRDDFDAVARAGADFEHVAGDQPGGRVVGQQRALEDEIVGDLARDALGRCDLCHAVTP